MGLIRSKYKHTEVGSIPSDWSLKIFKDIFKVNQGLQIAIDQRQKHPSLKSKKYITIQYLNDGKSVEYINDYSESVCCERKDILMTRTGNTGMVITNVEGVFHNNFFKINFDRNKLDKDFIVFFLKQSSTQRRIMDKAGTSTIPDLNHNDFYSLSIPLPPTLEEQKSIATALTDVDELIYGLEKLISKKKNIKQGAMQQLLTPPHKGGKRLPGFSGEWVVKTIGKIGVTFGGLSGKSKKDFENGSYPYITFLNVISNTIINTSIFDTVNIKPGENQNKVQKGDILFNTSSETPEEVGMCALLLEEIQNLYLNSFCFGFRLRDDSIVDGLFLSYLINSFVGRNLFSSLAQGATRYNLSKSNFNQLKIDVPATLEEQQKIVEILNEMDVEITQLETKKEKYQAIKQGMMQELLTGKTRLL